MARSVNEVWGLISHMDFLVVKNFHAREMLSEITNGADGVTLSRSCAGERNGLYEKWKYM